MQITNGTRLFIGTRLSSSTKDFTLNHGFGVSGEIYGGITYGMAFNTRGDNQVTKVLLSRTVTLASATTLNATGDWAHKADATAQEKANAAGTIVIGQNTMLGITANIMAMQKGGTGYYRSRLELLVRMDGAGTATLIDATEYEKKPTRTRARPPRPGSSIATSTRALALSRSASRGWQVKPCW